MKINQLTIDNNSVAGRLSNIPNVPKTLYSIGSLPPLTTKLIAIVGSRRPTSYGRDTTERLASQLAANGASIISGMALGIDAIAHRSAIAAGGHTVAVLPSGLDNPYPKTNHQLARKILASGGVLISEHKSDYHPHHYDFLLRNRIVSGLADAVVVTEANLRSGTLSTVAHALAQGKDVYAVPGPITSPLSAGCNRLIKQGANPITDIDSFLEEIGLTGNRSEVAGDDQVEQDIINLIKQGTNDGEDIVVKLGIEYSEFAQVATVMEIKGYITSLGANRWRLGG